MRVAVIIDTWFPFIGGGQINAWEISKRIAKGNIFIDIITRNNGQDNLNLPKNLKVYKLGPESKPDDQLAKIAFLFRLFKFLSKENYDIIHVHPFLPTLPAKFISIFKAIPIILTVHGTRLFENRSQLTPTRLLEKFILTQIKYDLQISVTHAFLKIKNINHNIQVISNGINLNEFDKVLVKKSPFPKILWVGRFDPVKRVSDLVLATKIVSRSIPDIKLVLVGYGYGEEKIKKLVNKLQLSNVQFKRIRSRSDLIKEYKSSHLFVLPSASEGQPLTLLEAQAAKVAVVATNVGGIPEIIKHGVNGLLVPPNKPEILAKVIIKVITQKNNFSKNGYTGIKKHYSWNYAANLTKNVYLNLLREK